MFSSTMPVQFVASILQACHDDMERVAARISATVSELGLACVQQTMYPYVPVVGSRSCAGTLLSLLPLFGRRLRLKEPEASPNPPSCGSGLAKASHEAWLERPVRTGRHHGHGSRRWKGTAHGDHIRQRQWLAMEFVKVVIGVAYEYEILESVSG